MLAAAAAVMQPCLWLLHLHVRQYSAVLIAFCITQGQVYQPALSPSHKLRREQQLALA